MRIFAHTAPGGLFAFDMNSLYALSHDMFSQSDLTGPVAHSWKAHWDRQTRLCRVEMDFAVLDKETGADATICRNPYSAGLYGWRNHRRTANCRFYPHRSLRQLRRPRPRPQNRPAFLCGGEARMKMKWLFTSGPRPACSCPCVWRAARRAPPKTLTKPCPKNCKRSTLTEARARSRKPTRGFCKPETPTQAGAITAFLLGTEKSG